jgi:nucleotide-binding universal stress UspA family protein
MTSFQKVLLPTDGSEESKKALDAAVNLARAHDGTVHVIYVVNIGVDTNYEAVSELMGELESSKKFEEIGQEATESLEKKLKSRDIEFEVEIIRGVPHREINRYASENDLDVIVMSTHGRTGLDRMLLGSVTEKVVRSSEIPVMTVRRD